MRKIKDFKKKPALENDSYLDYVLDLRESYLSAMFFLLTGSIAEDSPLPNSGAMNFDPVLREHGWDWPSKSFTMIGEKRMQNFRNLIESVIGNNVPGDIVETGVWRGGACIYARAILKVYQQTNRRVFVCDSFEGLPPPDLIKFPDDADSSFHLYPELSVSLEDVKANFEKLNLLDNQVIFVKGWFKDTMPTLNVKQIAVLRLDGDMYESTIDPLNHLYSKVSPGGWVIIDDYEVVPACKAAVHDFFKVQDLNPELYEIDGVGRYFQKPIE